MWISQQLAERGDTRRALSAVARSGRGQQQAVGLCLAQPVLLETPAFARALGGPMTE